MNMVRLARTGMEAPTTSIADFGNHSLDVESLLLRQHDRIELQRIPFERLQERIELANRLPIFVLMAQDRAALVSVEARAVGPEGDVIGEGPVERHELVRC